MSGTPGHGGKVCDIFSWWEDREPSNTVRGIKYIIGFSQEMGHWRYARSYEWRNHLPRIWTEAEFEREGISVLRCPACGITLVPDPEPLPVPEGFSTVREEPHGPTGLRILAKTESNAGYLMLQTDYPNRGRDLWRRAFSKEPK